MPGVTSVMRAILRGRRDGRRLLPGFGHLPLAQCAAVLLAARNHPDGLSHREMCEDGLSACSGHMTAADLDACLAKFGLTRGLKRARAGSWTYDRALEVIARDAREHGHMPTSASLTRRGGDLGMAYHTLNCSPDGFRGGMDELLIRYPDLPRPHVRRDVDGRPLDSHQEVVVAARLRAALPGVPVVAGVRLPVPGRRWVADFLVGGRVYVEVLMVPLDERSDDPRRRTYRERTAAKVAACRAHGLPVLTITPHEVVSTALFNHRLRELSEMLDTAVIMPEVIGPARRALGSWSCDEYCLAEARRLAGELGRWPTRGEITRAGCSGLLRWVMAQGGPRAAAARVGAPYLRQPHLAARRSARQRLAVRRLAARLHRTGRFPTQHRRPGRRTPYPGDIAVLGGAVAARRVVAEQLGQPVASSRRPDRYWHDPKHVLEVARPLAARLGRVPTICELMEAAGSKTIGPAVARLGGMPALHALLGPDLPIRRHPRGHWTRRDVLVALARDARARPGQAVTAAALVRLAGSIAAGDGIRRVGGLATVLAWLAEDDEQAGIAQTGRDRPD